MAKKEIMFKNPSQKTFKELCAEHQRYCKINNLSPVTLNTYKIAETYFIRFVGEDIICKTINQETIDNYKLYLLGTDISAVTVNTYIHNLSPAIKFGMKRGYINSFIEFKGVHAQEKIKDIYTPEELKILLKKPNVKKRGFAEFRNWAIINFLLATGVRARELRNVKIEDIDFENNVIKLQITKNNKARIVPISTALKSVLTEYLTYRQSKSDDDYLFSNIFGEQLPRTTLQMSITKYCKKRGIEKYSLHLFRHCFATNYLRAGGNPLTLQRILGHSTLKMVNKYIQMNTRDLQQDIDKFNPLDNVVRSRIQVDKKK
mgnify:CR=1 FL=1